MADNQQPGVYWNGTRYVTAAEEAAEAPETPEEEVAEESAPEPEAAPEEAPASDVAPPPVYEDPIVAAEFTS